MNEWPDTLERLHRDATARHTGPLPSWDHVTERARAVTSATMVLQGIDAADSIDVAGDVLEMADTYGQVAEALSHQYPSAYVTAADLRAIDASKLESLQRGAQGGWFELAAGKALDDGLLPMPPGSVEWRFPPAGTPGYDVEFLDRDGHIIETVQLKATTSLAYVRQALERYPDIPIVATTEVAREAADAGLGDVVADSGIPLSDFPGVGPLRLTSDDFNPLSDDFNVDLDVLDAALFGADILLATLTGGEVRAAMADATARAGRRIGREFLLNTVAEVAMQATGSAAVGNVVGITYATYRIGRTGKMVLDFRDQEVGFTTRQIQRYGEMLDELGSVA